MQKEKKPKKTKPFDIKEFIVKTLRGAFKKTELYHKAKARAKEEFFEKSLHGKDLRRVRFTCAKCGRKFVDRKGAKEIAVDHIEPIVRPETGWTNYEDFVTRLFCSVENLQVLCNYAGERDGVKSCHKIKTAEERAHAAARKREDSILKGMK